MLKPERRPAPWWDRWPAALGCSKWELSPVVAAVLYVGAHLVKAKALGML